MRKRYYFLMIILLIVINIVIMHGTVKASSDKDITSTDYVVSKENLTISRILPQTNIDTVKKSFNVDSSKVHVYDKEGKQEIKQGLIGTGMQIRFDNHETIYIASVIGDLTGNGRIEQIEVSKVIKHVIGLRNHQLIGVNSISADVSANGIVDLQDISILIKYVVFGKLDIGELIKPAEPIIEIVKGTEGANEWYTSDVELKIKRPENTPIPIVGMFYEITGPNSKELTSVKNEETITFTEEGIYEIKYYSITAVGEKSVITTKTIKIDKTDPVAGTMNLYINDIGGERYTENTWTNQNICLELVNGTDGLNQNVKTIYKVTGAVETGELTQNARITKEGIYIVTVITTDNSGRTAERTYQINIDKTKPVSPSITVEEGSKLNQDGEWYTSKVKLKVMQGTIDEGKSGISYTTYEISGRETVEETRIDNEGEIELSQDGTYEITAYNYDVAGNKSEGTKLVIKEDKTSPQNIELTPAEVTGTKIHLQISATEETSGIALYQIYVDDELYREIESTSNMIELDITDLSSKVHNLTVTTKDLAGNVSSANKQINMGRMALEDIEYVEFVVDNFTQTKDNKTVTSGASYIISDTSTSNVAKYIQVSSEEAQVKGDLTGRIRVVRKSGEIVDKFEYYPENLAVEILEYSFGSGSTWTHEASVNMANTILSNEGISDETVSNSTIYIKEKQNSDNTFSVTDKKESGTKTYTRLIINSVTINGEKVMFKITSDVI